MPRSRQQQRASQKNIAKAARAARKKRTIARLPKKTRTALGKQGAKVARGKRRHGRCDESPIAPALRTMNDKFRAKQLRAHLRSPR